MLTPKTSSGSLLGPRTSSMSTSAAKALALARRRSSSGLAQLKKYRTAYAWGRNDYGQLALGHNDRIGMPQSVVFEGT